MSFQQPDTSKTNSFSDRTGIYLLSGLGVFILGLCGFIVHISQEFHYARWEGLNYFIWQYILLAATLGGVLLAFFALAGRIKPSFAALGIVFAVGLLARLMMFASEPVLEDDWHRYLWDGASVASGVDPYKFAPAEATPVTLLGEQLVKLLQSQLGGGRNHQSR